MNHAGRRQQVQDTGSPDFRLTATRVGRDHGQMRVISTKDSRKQSFVDDAVTNRNNSHNLLRAFVRESFQRSCPRLRDAQKGVSLLASSKKKAMRDATMDRRTLLGRTE